MLRSAVYRSALTVVGLVLGSLAAIYFFASPERLGVLDVVMAIFGLLGAYTIGIALFAPISLVKRMLFAVLP